MFSSHEPNPSLANTKARFNIMKDGVYAAASPIVKHLAALVACASRCAPGAARERGGGDDRWREPPRARPGPRRAPRCSEQPRGHCAMFWWQGLISTALDSSKQPESEYTPVCGRAGGTHGIRRRTDYLAMRGRRQDDLSAVHAARHRAPQAATRRACDIACREPFQTHIAAVEPL